MGDTYLRVEGSTDGGGMPFSLRNLPKLCEQLLNNPYIDGGWVHFGSFRLIGVDLGSFRLIGPHLLSFRVI